MWMGCRTKVPSRLAAALNMKGAVALTAAEAEGRGMAGGSAGGKMGKTGTKI